MNWHDPIVEVFGEFDPLRFNWVRSLTLAFERQPAFRLDVDVLAAYGSSHFVMFRMRNARNLRIGHILQPILELGELFIDSLEGHGLEGIKYQIHDELGALSCYCEELEVIKIVESHEIDGDKVIWPVASP